jgi:hypothetical protein
MKAQDFQVGIKRSVFKPQCVAIDLFYNHNPLQIAFNAASSSLYVGKIKTLVIELMSYIYYKVNDKVV